MCEKQRTLGDMVSDTPNGEVPVCTHPKDVVYCEDRKDFVNREDAQESDDGKFYSEDTDLVECDACTAIITEDDCDDYDGFCESCREEREQCINCNDWHLDEDITTCNDGNHWCESCHNDNFYFCQGCDDSHPQEDCKSSDDGEIYCDSCYSDNFSQCNSCCEEVENSSALTGPDSESYCENCYCEAWTTCENCDDEVSSEESHYHNDRSLCNDCYTSECEDEEGGEGNRPEFPTPRVWTGSNVCVEMGSMRKYGVELELTHCDDYGGWIDKNVWGVTTDGSVSNGMEFITAPIAGDEGLAAVRAFCDKATEKEFVSGSNCGYHLHCDLTGSSPDERKSIALAYHYTCELWHDFIDRSRYDIMYSRLNSETKHDYVGYHSSPGGRKRKTHWDRKSIIAGNGHPDPSERYIWLNWAAYSKHRTVEIRSHHPTCNGVEVTNWVKAHIKFIESVIKMTVGQVTRTFGGNIKGKQMSELRHCWDDNDLFDFYNKLYEKRNSHCLV